RDENVQKAQNIRYFMSNMHVQFYAIEAYECKENNRDWGFHWITAIDPDRKAYEMGLPFIQKAGVEYKIKYI
ncbi:uncharacterized protein A4U43_C08F3170, partial [Asparagus officinalis]